ncbi:MAG TPA: HAMP domain-containing sensor histidine kinase, partial [Ktedonobacterales bacterium]
KRLELRCEPVDAGWIAQEIVEKMAPLAWRGSKVEIAAEVPPDLPLAHADASRLEQVLQNLLHNAVRHTAPGGIVAVVAEAEAEPASVALHVKDTGEGIAPEDLPRIFERFYRGESSRTRPGTGSGLGLALVKELTEAMGGTVTVESTPGLGSSFTVRLPLASVTRQSIAPEEKPLTAGRA